MNNKIDSMFYGRPDVLFAQCANFIEAQLTPRVRTACWLGVMRRVQRSTTIQRLCEDAVHHSAEAERNIRRVRVMRGTLMITQTITAAS